MRRLAVGGLILSVALAGVAAKTKAKYWQWGAGFYAGSPIGSESDEARWDWLVLNFGNMGASEETLQRVNRNLKLNPRQKYLGELWPINNLAPIHRYVGQATFLDHRYHPQVKESLEKELRRQVRILLDKIDKPENVVGFTFLEEVPGNFGAGNQISWAPDPTKLPPLLEEFRKEIEAERGKPLAWDDEARRWVGRAYVESINRMHQILKEEAPDKLVLYWLHSGYGTLDDFGTFLPEGAALSSPSMYAYSLADIIKPGLCEGFMAYPNNAEVWEKKYMRHVRKNGWLFFSQLSHPGFMRLQSWTDAIQMAKTKLPQNLGYFLYCQGDCAARKQWNEDPTVPSKSEESFYTVSMPLHIRRFCAQEKIGQNVVARSLKLEVQMDVPIKGAKVGDILRFVALIRNPKDPSYYVSPEDAVARDVRARLSLPRGFTAESRYSAPTVLSLGDMNPGERKAADWWVTVTKSSGEKPLLGTGNTLKVAVTSANTEPNEVVVTEDVAIPAFQQHEIRGSGESWMESGYRPVGGLHPVIVLEGLSTPIKNPSISDGFNTLTYKGELAAGVKVAITPDGKAKLFAADLVANPGYGLTDPNDPTGFKCFSEGYGVAGQYLGKYVKGGTKYRVCISGKADGGANSQVWLRCLNQERKVWETGLLWDSFAEAWRDNVCAEVEIPVGVNEMERVYLYRLNNKGRVWYGKISIQRADVPAEGVDVSQALSGMHPVLQPGTFTIVTYRDEDPPSQLPKVRVQLQQPGK